MEKHPFKTAPKCIYSKTKRNVERLLGLVDTLNDLPFITEDGGTVFMGQREPYLLRTLSFTKKVRDRTMTNINT